MQNAIPKQLQLLKTQIPNKKSAPYFNDADYQGFQFEF